MANQSEAQRQFEQLVRQYSNEEMRCTIDDVKSFEIEAATTLAAILTYPAFCAPGTIPAVYDQLCTTWLGRPSKPAARSAQQKHVAELPRAFWDAYWQIMSPADQPSGDAASLTARTAALGGLLDPGFQALALKALQQYQGIEDIDERPVPALISLKALALQPEGSLARDLHGMWTDNNFDPEVLDREEIGLAHLPPSLRYLNTRILQMHDVWHLVAGYRTTALHEIAISAFQLAQFGHNYSAMFLAVIVRVIGRHSPTLVPTVFSVIAEAWCHGRDTPPLMAVAWEDVWHQSIQALRLSFGISAFHSETPADLFEQLTVDKSAASL